MPRNTIAVLSSILLAACSDASRDAAWDEESQSTVTAGAAGISTPARWTGRQTCMGSGDDRKAIDTTSMETALGAFAKTKTRVSITGVDVGPSDEYSCTDLSFEGVVTDGDTSHTSFETATEDSARQLHCSSASGRALIVGWLQGYDSDLSNLDGPWNLHFRVRMEEPVDNSDAGVRLSSRVNIRCEFDFSLE